MTGIDDLIICPRCLKSMGEEVDTMVCQYCGYNEKEELVSSEDALIIELQNKCDKKQEHIVVLENKIRRMREAIHKLEWLVSHRNADLMRENEKLKKELKRCKYWLNSDKYDYELTLSFIKNKGYSLKDVLEYEKELKKDD